MAKQLWGGRFSQGLDARAQKLSYSLAIDKELLPYDILVSSAHVKTLAKARFLTAQEARTLVKGLQRVEKKLAARDMRTYEKKVEDIHTLIQNELEACVGAVARKLHTARSRNDQVVTATRLYVKDYGMRVCKALDAYQKALVEFARKGAEVPIPGYTHVQRAQVVLMAHHILAYVEMAARDKARLQDALKRVDAMPLGSGALAGLAFPLDRAYTAKLLGFSSVMTNSMDAVSARDFVAEILSAIAILFMHLSRLCEDLILWSSQEFGYVAFSDAFATGSSIMPHKKNADMCELTRGRAGKVYGNLLSVLTMMKGLPLSYNRDMQEDKEPLFSSLNIALDTLAVCTPMLKTMTIRHERCIHAAHDSFLYATDIMDALVKQGVPLRDAHHAVGTLVRYALDNGKELSSLRKEEIEKLIPYPLGNSAALCNAEQSLLRRKTSGSTNPQEVRRHIARWEKILNR